MSSDFKRDFVQNTLFINFGKLFGNGQVYLGVIRVITGLENTVSEAIKAEKNVRISR